MYLPHLWRIRRRRGLRQSIRNLSRRAPQVLFDRGMGEYGWAQELCEDEWDELLSRLGLEDVEPADFVACCLQWIGSDSIEHFRWGHAPCYVQPGRLDRCPLPVLGCGFAVVRPRFREEILCESSDAPEAARMMRAMHRRPDEGVDSKGAREGRPATRRPSVAGVRRSPRVKARGSQENASRRPPPPAPATPATPSAAGGSFGVSLRRGRRAKPRFSANPRKMAVETATPVRGSITLKDGTSAPKPDIVETERNPEPTQPIDIMKMPVKDLRAALATKEASRRRA